MEKLQYTNPTHRHWLLMAFSCLPLEEVRKLPTVCSTWAKWIREDKTPRYFADRRVRSFQNLSLRGALRLASFVHKFDTVCSCNFDLRAEYWDPAATWLQEAIRPETLQDLKQRLEDGRELEGIRNEALLTSWLDDKPPRTAFFSEYWLGKRVMTTYASFLQLLKRNLRSEARMIAVAAFNHDWPLLDSLLEQGVSPNATNPSGDSALCDPEVLADVEACTGLLDRGTDVNKTAAGRMSPLQAATRSQYWPTVTLLLQRGANPALKGFAGRMPLHEAAQLGDEAPARQLIEAGAPLDAQCDFGWTPLHYVYKSPETCMILFPEVYRLLLEKGANPNLLDLSGRSCLSWAAATGVSASVTCLLSPPHDPPLDLESADEHGQTALWWAVVQNRLDNATALLKAGASPNVTNAYGTSLACVASSVEVLALLLDHGASIENCLARAAQSGDLDRVSLLLARGAAVNGDDPKHVPLLFSAGQPAVFARLLEAGADLTATYNDGCGFLHMAAICEPKDFSPVDTALERGLDINESDDSGRTPLLYALDATLCPDYLEHWLARGAKIDGQMKEGNTVLHLALLDDRDPAAVQNAVAFLLDNGASIDLTDTKGRSAMTFALGVVKRLQRACALVDQQQGKIREVPDCDETFRYEHKFSAPHRLAKKLLEESKTLGRFRPDKFVLAAQKAELDLRAHRLKLVTLLLQHGAAVDAPYHKGFHPLHRAAMEGDQPLAQLLLDSEASADGLDARGRSPLHWAAIRGHLALVKLLLTRGAKQDLMDSEGNLSCQLAASAGHKSIVKHLSAKD